MSWSDRRSARAVVPREHVTVAERVSATAYMREVVAAGTVEALVREAEREAARIREEAEAAREALWAEARRAGEEAGRREGYEAGRQAGEAEGLRRAAEEASRMLDALTEELAAMRRAAVAELATLAVRVASELYGRQIEADPDHVAEVVRAVLAEAAPRDVQMVEVHPLDLPAILRARAGWRASDPSLAELRVVPVPDVARGACRVLTDGGWIERDWPGALEELARRWRGATPGERDT
jgi:flagellar assembly protein FliH